MDQQTSEATSESIKRALNNPSDAKAIDALISIIISKDQEWQQAAKALGRIGFPKAGDKLVKIFLGKASESDPKLQALHWYDLFDVLEEVGGSSVDTLANIVRDSKYLIRFRIGAINTLCNIGGTEATIAFIEAIHNNDFETYFSDKAVDVKYFLRKVSENHIPNVLLALPDWYLGPLVLTILQELEWKPTTEKEKVHYHVARRDSPTLSNDWDNTRRILLDDILSGNLVKIQNALYAFIGLGRNEILKELIDTLESKGTKDMAIAFLNCGNAALVEASRSWAKSRGFTIIPWGGKAPVHWGTFSTPLV